MPDFLGYCVGPFKPGLWIRIRMSRSYPDPEFEKAEIFIRLSGKFGSGSGFSQSTLIEKCLIRSFLAVYQNYNYNCIGTNVYIGLEFERRIQIKHLF